MSNLPHAATEDVAVHALAGALSLVRALPQADATVRGGGWNTEFAEVPRRAGELTLGLLGFGRIARALARIAAPVFGRVAAYDPHADEAGWPDGVERLGLDELVSRLRRALPAHAADSADPRHGRRGTARPDATGRLPRERRPR